MLSNRMTSGLCGSAARNSSRFVTSTSIHATRPPGRLRGRERGRNAACQANMIFLDQDGTSARSFAVAFAATHEDRVLFQACAGRVWFCAYPESPRRSLQSARTNRRVSVATPLSRCKRFNATRSPDRSPRAHAFTRAGIIRWGKFFAVRQNDFPLWLCCPEDGTLRRTIRFPARTSGALAITSPRAHRAAETVISCWLRRASSDITSARKGSQANCGMSAR